MAVQIKTFKANASDNVINKFLSNNAGSQIVSYDPVRIQYDNGDTSVEIPILTLSGSYVDMTLNDTGYSFDKYYSSIKEGLIVSTFTFFKDRVMLNDEYSLDFQSRKLYVHDKNGNKHEFSDLVDIDFVDYRDGRNCAKGNDAWYNLKGRTWVEDIELRVIDFSRGLSILKNYLIKHQDFAPIEHYYAYNLKTNQMLVGSQSIANALHGVGYNIEKAGKMQAMATIIAGSNIAHSNLAAGRMASNSLNSRYTEEKVL